MRISDWSSDVCSSDLQAREGRAIVARGRAEAIEDFGETVRPLVERPGEPLRQHACKGGEAEDDERQHRDREHRELDLARLDLLADIFGGAPAHEARDEHREDREEQKAIDARADPADDDLAELDGAKGEDRKSQRMNYSHTCAYSMT